MTWLESTVSFAVVDVHVVGHVGELQYDCDRTCCAMQLVKLGLTPALTIAVENV